MPTFRETATVFTDPDTAWKVVGDLVSVDRWIPGLTDVRMYGSTRVCSFADGNVLREEIFDYTPKDRSYRYTSEGGLPVRDNTGRLSVEPTDTGCRIILDSSWEALDPATEDQLAGMWGTVLPSILARLAEVIETGADPAPPAGAPFAWFDLRTGDPTASAEFYAELAGWSITGGPADGGAAMSMIGTGQPWGAITDAGPVPAGWVPYLPVEDVTAAAERATKLGATVILARTEGPAGATITIVDPTGATLALWQPRQAP